MSPFDLYWFEVLNLYCNAEKHDATRIRDRVMRIAATTTGGPLSDCLFGELYEAFTRNWDVIEQDRAVYSLYLKYGARLKLVVLG